MTLMKKTPLQPEFCRRKLLTQLKGSLEGHKIKVSEETTSK